MVGDTITMGQDKATVETERCRDDAIAQHQDKKIEGNIHRVREFQEVAQSAGKPAEPDGEQECCSKRQVD